MNGSSVSLNFLLHIQFFSFVWHSGTFLCMIFWFINTFSTCGQSAPLSSFWRMGLTFDCHISLLKFPNRSYETTCFHCMEMLDCLPQMVLICTFDGNLLIVKWTVSLGKILCCLPFMGFAFFIYLVILSDEMTTRLMSIESVMPSNNFVLCPLLLLPSATFQYPTLFWIEKNNSILISQSKNMFMFRRVCIKKLKWGGNLLCQFRKGGKTWK